MMTDVKQTRSRSVWISNTCVVGDEPVPVESGSTSDDEDEPFREPEPARRRLSSQSGKASRRLEFRKARRTK